MRPFAHVITLDEARAIVANAARPITRVEPVTLLDAPGRVLAEEVHAAINVPAFDRAMMDGYAVRMADTKGASAAAPARLQLVDALFAGAAPERALAPGECVEIATGAPIPSGADAVVMVEETERHDQAVHIRTAARERQHIAPQGSDIHIGDLVLRAGEVLSAAKVGALAALGLARVPVYARPRVVIFSTGNEVVEPGQASTAASVYDVNRFTLTALVSAHGGHPQPRPPVSDDLDALGRAFDEACDADVLVCSGGSSVGERDLLLDVIRARGDVLFHGIAVKPGKPTAFARVGSTILFGMPGNPTSCLTNGYVLLVPLLRAMARLPPWMPATVRARLGTRVSSPPDRHQFYPVRVDGDVATPVFKGSGDITSLSQADGYFEIPAGSGSMEVGTEVVVRLFEVRGA
ncbi:MAG: molybdenum cofactor biosynthesis protein [Luteitalea sp.]|nr:molybdenum cofactor biosynthesis protein [Luteitalea sp.]